MRNAPGLYSVDSGGSAPRLAQRPLPRRVRALLEGVLKFSSDELDRGLRATLDEFEQQLFKMAEQARSNDIQTSCFSALREVKRGRADLVPRFLIGLEGELAALRDRPAEPVAAAGADMRAPAAALGELSLVADFDLEESITLNEIASRVEVRHSLPLFLLGQRFGVLAGRPALEPERLPIGPQALCSVLRRAAACLDVSAEYRLQLYRQFDRQVMQLIGSLYEAVNAYLVNQGVLPGITFVPTRAKPSAQRSDAPKPRRSGTAPFTETVPQREVPAPAVPVAEASPQPAPRRRATDQPAPSRPLPPRAGADAANQGARQTPPEPTDARVEPAVPREPQPFTAWPGTAAPEGLDLGADGEAVAADGEMFDVLRGLLAGRRSLLGKLGGGRGKPNGANAFVASDDDVQSVLGMLQAKSPGKVVIDGKPAPRTINHVKQDLLAQLREVTPAGMAPTLAEEQNDTVELMSLLFEHVMKDVNPNSAAAQLLTKLQVPLLRVALDDKGFFTRRQHPARQMLNAVAETGATWLGDDEADRGLMGKLNLLVDRVLRDFSGDLGLFENLLGDINTQMQTQARKAEVAERRHVEAARGREKLELARQQARDTVSEMLAGHTVPRFVSALMGQAWTDVLALSLLRGGEDSPVFKRNVELARSVVGIASREVPVPAGAAGKALKAEIEQALTQVGYDEADAAAVSGQLVSSDPAPASDLTETRTELAVRMKARARLGEASEGDAAPLPVAVVAPAPLDEAEQAQYDRIRHLPFGTWFEFMEADGARVRRRMSWYSSVTGHCLFVNHRGQRAADMNLDDLARMLHAGKAQVVMTQQGTLIDRAWQSIVGALRSFAGKSGTETATKGAAA